MAKDIYIEYSNGEFEYLSFTKAKNLINKIKPNAIKYTCIDSEKSINFLNKLLVIYKTDGDKLVLK